MIFDCVRGQVQLCRDRFGRRAAQYKQRDLGFPCREPQRAKDQRRIAPRVGRFDDHGNLVIGGAIADGKIVERWGRLDDLGLLQQLGLSPNRTR
jgi:hypothetical protein